MVLAAVIVLVVLVATGGNGGASGPSTDVLPEGGEVPEQQVFDLQQAARASGCELKAVKGSGRNDTTDPSERVHYNSNPPTTGRHFITPPRTAPTARRPRTRRSSTASSTGG